MLLRTQPLCEALNFQCIPWDNLRFFIDFTESELNTIDIYFNDTAILGTIYTPLYDGDSVRFYVHSDYSEDGYNVILGEQIAKVVIENALTLYRTSQTSVEVYPEGHVDVSAHILYAAYCDLKTGSVTSVYYKD